MGITAAAVKELRERTGAGMMDCKKALVEVEGDLDEAIKFLRTKGLAAAAKRAHRSANDGMVGIVGDASRKAILELNCESEPVSKLAGFRDFGNALVQQVLDSGAASVKELKAQPYSGDPKHSVEESISLKIATIGENIVLNRCALVEAPEGNKLGSYIHMGGKMGVVVEGTETVTEEALHDVALHIAASSPRYVGREEVTDEILATEKEIALRQAKEQGKPEAIAEKIVVGKMEKFFEQEVLLEQPFAKDSSVSVGAYLKTACGNEATIKNFVRFQLGQGSGE
ncbi:MAG: translation elongation factor Ts [Thermoanaerobaculales bacterium]|nr:translation elongation factor Ts [Thermoanaerobaculales bacterium]